MAATAKAFPALGPTLKGMAYRETPQSDGRMLEYYPPGETDSFDPSRPAMEVFSDRVTPWDVAGDVVSHGLLGVPEYRGFEQSLTPEQQGILREQYRWAQQNEGEQRPYQDWYSQTGLPAYFRGYAFRQWPEKDLYTQQQRSKFDAMIARLRGGGR